jgi:exoribonuclease-2
MIRVASRLTYEQADRLLESGTCALADALRSALRVADRLRRERVGRGAVRLVRPEVKVRVADGAITVCTYDPDTPSRQVVSEMMVLANRLAAEYALAKDVPIIYRVQDPPQGDLPQMTRYTPAVFERTIRRLGRTRLSTHPQPHAGLGLDAYTQITSPIRRYADLVIQRQLTAHLAAAARPYTPAELIEVLSSVDQVEGQNRQLERDAVRYWLLEYVRRQPADTVYPARLLGQPGAGRQVELEAFPLRGDLTVTAAGNEDDPIAVRVARADPDQGRLVVEPA